jgi:hypothetical protein
VADTPFARALAVRGFSPDAPRSLELAVEAMRKDGVDSDGDGAQDLDELGWGGDPNVPDLPVGVNDPSPAYGCAIRRAERGAPRTIGVLGLALGLLRRARRRTLDFISAARHRSRARH